jgi:hypothetical protein
LAASVAQSLSFLFNAEREYPGDGLHDFVLDGENVVQLAVVSFCPELDSTRCLNKLCRDADAVAALANAALYDIRNAQLATYVLRPVLVPL